MGRWVIGDARRCMSKLLGQEACALTPTFVVTNWKKDSDLLGVGAYCTGHVLQVLNDGTAVRWCELCGTPVPVRYEANYRSNEIHFVPKVDECPSCGRLQTPHTGSRSTEE
jgi:hypothetical protein